MKVQNNQKNREKCLCPNCPSYPKDCQDEVLYCSDAIGHSRCDIDAKGCVCPGCVVWSENNLKEIYYCTRDVVGEKKIVMRKKKSGECNDFYQTVVDIKTIAETGEGIVRPMGSLKKIGCEISLAELHFVPAQISKIPLNREENVNTEVVIGPAAKKPLKVSSPIMITGMSFGATSRKVHIVISRVAKELRIAFNSGEGGIIDEHCAAKDYLIAQYATGKYGINEDILKKVAAIEIRFGQGAYPGKGSYLPARKMTEEVRTLRGIKEGEPSYSPAHRHDMKTPGEIKDKISWLKEKTGGVPIGAKIGCGNIEEDIEILASVGVDYIAIDGFGGGTGATGSIVKDNVGVHVWMAIPKAFNILKSLKMKEKISLIAGGNLRTSADFAKCLALGADAVYIGTAALIAINCQQYRICHTGLCPTGITTHNPELIRQLDIENGVRKLKNFVKVSTEEIAEFVRIVGKNDVKKISKEDLVSMTKDLADICGARWIGSRFVEKLHSAAPRKQK